MRMRHTLIVILRKIRAVLGWKYKGNLPYVITVAVALFLVVGGINVFIELTDTLTTEFLAGYDAKITQYIISYRNPYLTRYFLFVTYLGDVYGYLVVVIICLLVSMLAFKNWKYVAQTTLVLILASVSNTVLKRFIARARPGIEHLVSVETLSYPSGHAMSAMAFYGFVIYLIYRFKLKTLLKFVIITVLGLLILSIGISRIYLGVHFPSDIVGGFIAGLIWVIFCILVFDLVEIFRRDPQAE